MTLKAFNEVKIKFDRFDDLQWSKSSFRALKVAAPDEKTGAELWVPAPA